jgi:hypothetical protein
MSELCCVGQLHIFVLGSIPVAWLRQLKRFTVLASTRAALAACQAQIEDLERKLLTPEENQHTQESYELRRAAYMRNVNASIAPLTAQLNSRSQQQEKIQG